MFLELMSLDKTETLKYSMRHYIVTGNTMVQSRLKHFRFAVVCTGIERAIELAKKHTPDVVITSVTDQGAIDKVDA